MAIRIRKFVAMMAVATGAVSTIGGVASGNHDRGRGRTLARSETRVLRGGDFANRCCDSFVCSKGLDCDQKDGNSVKQVCTKWNEEVEIWQTNDRRCDKTVSGALCTETKFPVGQDPDGDGDGRENCLELYTCEWNPMTFDCFQGILLEVTASSPKSCDSSCDGAVAALAPE